MCGNGWNLHDISEIEAAIAAIAANTHGSKSMANDALKDTSQNESDNWIAMLPTASFRDARRQHCALAMTHACTVLAHQW